MLKNPWNLTVRQEEKLSALKKSNQTLYRAYLLKESLARGMDYVQPKRASEYLDKWCQWASPSRLASLCLREAARRKRKLIDAELVRVIVERQSHSAG